MKVKSKSKLLKPRVLYLVIISVGLLVVLLTLGLIMLVRFLGIRDLGIKESLLTFFLVGVTGYYIYVSRIVHLKKTGEVIKDGLLSSFWISLIWFGFCLGMAIPFLTDHPLSKSFSKDVPSWTCLLVEICFVFLTFRTLAEGISITRRYEDKETGKKVEEKEDGKAKEDPGLFLIKVSAEMLGVFLLFPVTFIYVATALGIRWWKLISSGPLGGLLFVSALAWCIVIYILPGTYKNTQRGIKMILPLIFLILIGFSLYVGGRSAGLPWGLNTSGWKIKNESFFEYRKRMALQKKRKVAREARKEKSETHYRTGTRTRISKRARRDRKKKKLEIFVPTSDIYFEVGDEKVKVYGVPRGQPVP